MQHLQPINPQRDTAFFDLFLLQSLLDNEYRGNILSHTSADRNLIQASKRQMTFQVLMLITRLIRLRSLPSVLFLVKNRVFIKS